MRLVPAAVLLLSATVLAKPVRTPVPYELEGKAFEGILLHDDAAPGPLPGLLLVPNWLGINEANLAQAEEVAKRGYVVFVADLYGKSVRPKNPTEGGKAAGEVRGDRKLMRARVARAFTAMQEAGKRAKMDSKRVGAIGFCFGGTAVLELARTGADVAGVVSFHGGLDAPMPPDAKVRARVLALHGADDPTVPAEGLAAFKEDMRKSGVDWQLVEYGGAVHSFTDKDANTPGRSMYHPLVAARAFRQMEDFFRESFSR